MKRFIKMISVFAQPFVLNKHKTSPFTCSSKTKTRFITFLKAMCLVVQKFARKNFPATGQISGIPLVKATTPVSKNHSNCLRGKSVLCVGGQILLYPAYRQIVEDAGGQFLSFHGVADAVLTDLDRLLNDADFVICPIDCIRHDAFFRTKHYCNCSGKPCVILDKARVTTFYNGIRMLKQYAIV